MKTLIEKDCVLPFCVLFYSFPLIVKIHKNIKMNFKSALKELASLHTMHLNEEL